MKNLIERISKKIKQFEKFMAPYGKAAAYAIHR